MLYIHQIAVFVLLGKFLNIEQISLIKLLVSSLEMDRNLNLELNKMNWVMPSSVFLMPETLIMLTISIKLRNSEKGEVILFLVFFTLLRYSTRNEKFDFVFV